MLFGGYQVLSVCSSWRVGNGVDAGDEFYFTIMVWLFVSSFRKRKGAEQHEKQTQRSERGVFFFFFFIIYFFFLFVHMLNEDMYVDQLFFLLFFFFSGALEFTQRRIRARFLPRNKIAWVLRVRIAYREAPVSEWHNVI